MQPDSSIKERIFQYLKDFDFIVSASGVRYGSVIYIAFGIGEIRSHASRADTTHYPIELEFGSDYWELIREDRVLINSEFWDVDSARILLNDTLVGRTVCDLAVNEQQSVIIFDEDTLLISRIYKAPASGFLYSFQTRDQDVWETVDGRHINFT
jgi:hypothetical protein